MLKRIWEWIKALFKGGTKTMTFDFAMPERKSEHHWGKAELARMVRKTAGGHHAWYETTDGRIVRKPIQNLN